MQMTNIQESDPLASYASTLENYTRLFPIATPPNIGPNS